MSRFDAAAFQAALIRALEPFGLREAAKQIGVSSSTLSRIERGEVPSLETFFTLCDWMDVSPADFVIEPYAEPRPSLTHDDVVRRLRAAIDRAGDQRAWALAYDLSPQYVNDVLRGRREAGPSVLAALGLERVIRYQERKED